MSNTYEYEGKVYRIVPDGNVWSHPLSPCTRCAFRNDIDACRSQEHDDKEDADCILGNHHYVLDKEQA